ncbi:MAG: LysR family transcriptional regulator, partial [Lachnospiraceae bacterium]|nr:LysR family transcriptional regulator [Lachnospiraceae bacterium]
DIRGIPLKDGEPLSYGIFFKKSSQNPLLKKFISIVTNISYS